MPSSSNITKKEPDQDQELKEIEEEFDDMYPYTKESSKENLTYFVSAFDELQEQKRKLFGIPEIDNFLSFSDKKNIGIINRSSQQNTFNFLYYIIANVCISYHNKKENKKDGGKTILIDAGSENNLQFLYLNLVNRSLSLSADNTMLVNIDNILDNIIVARAFTFYQLANIIIKEIPKIIQKLDNRLQIIVLDLLDTLSLSSSSSSSFSYFHKKNGEETGGLIYNNSFQNNLKLLEEVIYRLTYVSKHLVINSSSH